MLVETKKYKVSFAFYFESKRKFILLFTFKNKIKNKIKNFNDRFKFIFSTEQTPRTI